MPILTDEAGTPMNERCQSKLKFRSKRTRNERGAVLVEGAIVVLFIAVLINGVLDYGTLFGDSDSLSGATRAAAIAGGNTGLLPVDDYTILRNVIDKPGTQRAGVERVVIYKAATGSAGPPAECMTGDPATVTQLCNIYTESDWDRTPLTLLLAPGANHWPAITRVPAVDYLGVWVKVNRTPFMNVIWTPGSYSDFFVVRLQRNVIVPGGDIPNNSDWSTGTARVEPDDPDALCWADPPDDTTIHCNWTIEYEEEDPAPGGGS